MTTARTEALHPDAADLHAVPAEDALARLLAGQRAALASVEAAVPALARVGRAAVGVLGRRAARLCGGGQFGADGLGRLPGAAGHLRDRPGAGADDVRGRG
ncbi:hypothetical protein [Paracoccus aestuarii]|uniref:hypothetical protein n=1 Tax=Paracoccus aestuarii TaxID=453842 RepID=UPI00234FB921|nr:hypothetical protein [Paracoccus aestuarii]